MHTQAYLYYINGIITHTLILFSVLLVVKTLDSNHRRYANFASGVGSIMHGRENSQVKGLIPHRTECPAGNRCRTCLFTIDDHNSKWIWQTQQLPLCQKNGLVS
ncbi:hypothetical protein Ac2012v2_005529 [Leucoagaricus gongylophorus]